MDTWPRHLGKIGYEAYAKFTGGKTFDGRDMPAWDDLGEKIQGAWTIAADAIWAAVPEGGRRP